MVDSNKPLNEIQKRIEMKILTGVASTSFLKWLTIFFVKCLLITTVVMNVSSCKKTNNPAPATPPPTGTATSTIVYKTFSADSVNFTADSLFFDVNNDGVYDIKVTMKHTLSGSTMSYSGSISAVNNNMSFCYMKELPNLTMLALNDIINSTDSFNWNPICTYIGSGGYVSGSNSWAQGIFTNYFGFKITLKSKNYYGWFRFKWQTITETGMNLTSEASIKVGQK